MTTAPTPSNAGDNDIFRYYSIPDSAGAGAGAARPPIIVKAKNNSYQSDVFRQFTGITSTPDAPTSGNLMSKKKGLMDGRLANVILILKAVSRTGAPGRSIVSIPMGQLEEVLKENGKLTGKQVGPKNRLVLDVRPCTR
jgi:hypothetical protein